MPSVTANEVLLESERVVGLLEATIDNTLTTPYQFEDHLCGNVGLCGNETGFRVLTNANIAVSNDQVPHLPTTLSLSGKLEVSRQIGEPFSGAVSSVSFANLTILNDESIEDFENRLWEDAIASIKVGGLIYKNQANEVNLVYGDYPVLFDGRFGSQDSNFEKINIPVLPISDELADQFPKRVFDYGESEGKVIPFILGQAFGFSPYRVEGALMVYHDGDVDAQVHEYVNPPFTYFGNDTEIVHKDWGLILEANGYSTNNLISYDSSDFDFIQNGDQAVVSTQTVDVDVSVDGDGITMEPVDGGFVVRRDDGGGIQKLHSGSFHWVRQPDEGSNVVLKDKGQSGCKVTMTSGVTFFSTGGRWFKTGNTSNGTITFTWPNKKIKKCRLVARSLIDGVTYIDNFSDDPKSFEPAIGPNSNELNHFLTFENVDSDSISFRYINNVVGFDLSAFWIDYIELAEAKPAKVVIDFDRDIYQLTLTTLIEGLVGLSSFSQDLSDTLGAPSVGVEKDLKFNEFGGGSQFNRITFNCDIYSGFARFVFKDVKEGSSNYGAFRDRSGFVLRPQPEFDIVDPFQGPQTVAGSAQVTAYIEDETKAFNAGVKYRYKARMRVVEGDLDRINVELSYPVYRKIEIGREWKEIDTIIDNVGGNAMLVTARVTRGVTSLVSPDPVNPDQDFAIEVDYVSCQILGNGVSDFPLYENSDGRDVRVPLYRVESCNRFNDLPTGIAFYDSVGQLAASTEYKKLYGDFIGGDRNQKSITAFKEISVLASGIDHVTNSVGSDGEKLSHVLDKQKPFFKHIAEMSDPLDYILSEFSVGQGFEVRRRYDYKSDANDFVIEENEIVHNSIQRVGSAPRQYRYEVFYAKDHRNDKLTKSVVSPVGYTGSFETKPIISPLAEKSDAENIGELIPRDSVPNDLRVLSLYGARLDLVEGMAGKINHPRVPRNTACVIRQATPSIDLGDGEDQTHLLVKILRGNG